MCECVSICVQEDALVELRGTAALDKMEGRVQTPADAPTQVQSKRHKDMLFHDRAVPIHFTNDDLQQRTLITR
jgi:hypothetical protein